MHHPTSSSPHNHHHHHRHHQQQLFQTLKVNCLSKRDKSSAGRIDPHAVDICAIINSKWEYYTTSSCSGRCFLYCGDGIKSWHHQTNSTTYSAASGDESERSGTAIDVIASDSIDNHAPVEPSSTQPTNTNKLGYFQRYRVNHDFIHEPTRYFDLTTLFNGVDPTGGGDPIPTIGQFDHGNNASFKSKLDETKIINNTTNNSNDNSNGKDSGKSTSSSSRTAQPSSPIWLRFEPFILHVMCHSLKSASILMAAARPAFKNVGLTSWHCDDDSHDDDEGDGMEDYGEDDDQRNDDTVMDDDVHIATNNHHQQYQQQQKQQCKKGKCPRYLVAIWGDEGLDMPLSLPTSPSRGLYYHPDNATSNAEWLASLVNERHARNWKKIERFVESMKSLEGEMPSADDDVDVDDEEDVATGLDGLELDTANDDNDTHAIHSTGKASDRTIPRSYDVVGDVAILNSLPVGDEEMQRRVGELIMSRNKAIKICVARTNPLSTSDRSPGANGMIQLAGLPRNPIVTSHYEFGVKCVVDLQQTFFSPRMAPERLRLSQQVARGERVLVVFAGVGMEALQIVSKTEAKEVLAIEKNEVAAECLRRARRMLERNKTITIPGGGVGAAERLSILEGDALELLPTLERASFDRIVAPRPKEGTMDGDMGTGDTGKEFLLAMLPLLKLKGEVHWYDFAADHELPKCQRTRDMVESVCHSLGLEMEVIHVAKVGSVAKRQFRVCIDFRITGRLPTVG